jgi:hypothetical protein
VTVVGECAYHLHLADLQFDAAQHADVANETEERDDPVAVLVCYDEAVGIAESPMECSQPVQEWHVSGLEHGFGVVDEPFGV